jgi:hypothetical protein
MHSEYVESIAFPSQQLHNIITMLGLNVNYIPCFAVVFADRPVYLH